MGGILEPHEQIMTNGYFLSLEYVTGAAAMPTSKLYQGTVDSLSEAEEWVSHPPRDLTKRMVGKGRNMKWFLTARDHYPDIRNERGNEIERVAAFSRVMALNGGVAPRLITCTDTGLYSGGKRITDATDIGLYSLATYSYGPCGEGKWDSEVSRDWAKTWLTIGNCKGNAGLVGAVGLCRQLVVAILCDIITDMVGLADTAGRGYAHVDVISESVEVLREWTIGIASTADVNRQDLIIDDVSKKADPHDNSDYVHWSLVEALRSLGRACDIVVAGRHVDSYAYATVADACHSIYTALSVPMANESKKIFPMADGQLVTRGEFCGHAKVGFSNIVKRHVKLPDLTFSALMRRYSNG